MNLSRISCAARYCRRLVLVLVCATACITLAQTADPDRHEGWNGTAAFGPIVFPKYTGGNGNRVWPIPLLSIDYNETFYVEIQRVGVYVLASDDKKIGLGLAAEPRFGFAKGDGARLAGMATRRDSLEGGITFDWDFDVVAFSLGYFNDLNRTSRGNSMRASIYKPLVKNQHWDFGVLLAFDRLSAKVADYYFGVPANEASAARALFHPGAGTNASLGISGTYNLDKRNSIIFGVIGTHLGAYAAASPIVETRKANMYYLGYGWRL
ncbi:MAG: MipA/OmpV family protein [Betaproteobacteria bacterium]|nr:MipA/OmpV family protein [Betaproteobacteria bacterium]